MNVRTFTPRPTGKNVPFRERAAEGPRCLRAASTRDALLHMHAFEQGVLHGYFTAGSASAAEFAEALAYLNEVARFCDAEFALDEDIAMATEPSA